MTQPISHPGAAGTVAIVYNSAWYLYQFRSPLIRELQALGFTVHAVSPEDGAEKKLTAMGIQHHAITLSQHGANPLAELRSIGTLAKTLRSIKPDLVISYTIKCNIYCGLLRKALRYRQIANIVGLGRVFEKGGLTAAAGRFLYRMAIAGADATFFQNNEDRDSFITHGVVRSEAAVVTPGSGVDLKRFSPSPPVDHSPQVFFMYGRLIPAKGFDLFVEAARRLRQRYQERTQFWIAGGLDGEQPASRELLQRLEAADKEGTIRFLGYREDIPELVASATTVVLPSTYNEGVPRSLLEALACAKPIVTTDWKGCRETLDGSRNGRLVQPGNLASLETALEQIITSTADERFAMGTASRLFAERVFDQRLVLAAYIAVVRRLFPGLAAADYIPEESRTS